MTMQSMPSADEYIGGNDHKVPDSFEPLPAATYLAVITDVTNSASNSGKSWTLKMTVADGPYRGRLLQGWHTYAGASEGSVTFGRRMLAMALRAAGFGTGNNHPSVLKNKTVQVAVTVSPGGRSKTTGKEYGPSNRINEYLTMDGRSVKDGMPMAMTAVQAPVQQYTANTFAQPLAQAQTQQQPSSGALPPSVQMVPNTGFVNNPQQAVEQQVAPNSLPPAVTGQLGWATNTSPPASSVGAPTWGGSLGK